MDRTAVQAFAIMGTRNMNSSLGGVAAHGDDETTSWLARGDDSRCRVIRRSRGWYEDAGGSARY